MNYISQNNSFACCRFHLADAPRLKEIELQINTVLSFSIIDVENSLSIEKELEEGEEFLVERFSTYALMWYILLASHGV